MEEVEMAALKPMEALEQLIQAEVVEVLVFQVEVELLVLVVQE